MKNIIINKFLGIAVLLLFLVSCSDILEEEMRSQLPLSAVDGKALIVDAYDQLAPIASDRQWYLMTETSTDICNFVGSNTRRRSFMNYSFDPGNSDIQGMWNILFNVIASSNTVLSRIDSSGVSEEERARITGEARFLRALSYFNAVRLFGEIPLVLKPAEAGDDVLPRVLVNQIYAQIIEDLYFSQNVLPMGYEGLDEGRATVGAAKALLGKVFLTRASYSKYNTAINTGGSIVEYDSARKYLNQVTDMNYSLVANYGNYFDVQNEYNSETVFDIKCFANGDYRNKNRGAADWAAQPNLYGGNSYSQTAMTKDFYNRFLESDGRTTLLVRGDYTTTNGESYETRIYERDSDTSYGNLIFSWKFLDSENPAADGGVGEGFQLGGVNYPLIRFSDVLLMLAEAELESGDAGRAKELIDEVRTRANLDGINEVTIETILEERSRELYLEGHRWFDLVRTAKLEEKVEAVAQQEGSIIHYDVNQVDVQIPKHYLYPIPQGELDLGLSQNPGY